jgi:hypothetical protein
MEYDGVRIDLSCGDHRGELEALANAYITAACGPRSSR